MQFKVITPVTAEPVSLAEARLQCKVDSDDASHDAVLTSLITAAREYAEHFTGRALAPVTLEAALDAFPWCSEGFDLPCPPVTEITSIKYTDPAGVEQTLAPAAYSLSTYGDSRTVTPAAGTFWPATFGVPDAVRVRFTAGYAGDTLPQALKAAMLLHIEMESPLSALTTAEREGLCKARDSLLNTKKIWG